MRRLSLAFATTLLLAALAAAPASASFGFETADVTFTNADGTPAVQAGSHPFAMTTSFDVNTRLDPETGKVVPDGVFKDLVADQPAGLAFDPRAVPRCSAADFLMPQRDESGLMVLNPSSCADATALGVIGARGEAGNPNPSDFGVVYNLVPPPGAAAKFGFSVLGVSVVLEGGVRPGGERNLFASLRNISQAEPFYGSVLTLWGNPADPAHDPERGDCLFQGGSCPTGVPQRPFITMPRSCAGPLITTFAADSWQSPGDWVQAQATTHDNLEPPDPLGMSGCAKVGFGPQISAQPTSHDAESPSGLDIDLNIRDEGLRSPSGIAQSDIEKAVVTLPEGVTVNPSQAEGLGVCSEADFARETADSEFGVGCPGASKIGTIEAESPLLEGEVLGGSVFVATPYENPAGSLIALYLVIKSPERGILVKLPAKVEPDPRTGQLITTVEDVPQLPVSRFHFHFREGGRSPLVTPPHCGTYETRAEFTPWANPSSPLSTAATFTIDRGVGGGPCPPGGVPPFRPGFTAGSISNSAGSYSPVYMRWTRADGEQDITKFSSVLPPGLVAKLAGVSRCPAAQIAAAKAKTGRQELADPSCPANSQLGRLLSGAGVGPELIYVPGSLYLAGPYHGDPLSVVAIVPAVAGPFDAGTVVVQLALTLNPATARAEVDGAASDPIPHILKGIVLKVRDVRVYADRPEFTLNPTSCRPSRFEATLFGSYLDVFSPADDVPVSLAERFQAADCASLGFKPRLSLRLKGGTGRGAHPALRAVVRPLEGDANFGRAVVTLPRSAFLDQAHIRTICTRVQFAAGAGNGAACPPGARYGFAKAWTPLLDEPLRGPVYLRSSSHNLPDLVAALHGTVDIDLVGRIDSHRGGIRSSFEDIPDAPVSRFLLRMQGGREGLIVNSRNLCAHRSRALARLTGQNGRRRNLRPIVRPSGCAKRHRHRRHRSR